MYKLFIVEDDEGIAQAIAGKAQSWGFEVRCAADFRNVLGEFAEFQPHIVLLDLLLPFYNGFHLCGEIRKISSVPVMFLSSASDNMNIVMAMSMGADDFIAKPFDFDVLIAKLNALLRRSYDFSGKTALLEHRGALLNTDEASLYFNGQVIELTKNEFRILLTLLENKKKVVSRERLMEALWKTDNFVDENTLSVNVGRLRKKLESYGLCDFITTKVGLGYIIE